MTFGSNKLEAFLILLVESKGLLMEDDCMVQERERQLEKRIAFKKPSGSYGKALNHPHPPYQVEVCRYTSMFLIY
jgi:hypothetical protein